MYERIAASGPPKEGKDEGKDEANDASPDAGATKVNGETNGVVVKEE